MKQVELSGGKSGLPRLMRAIARWIFILLVLLIIAALLMLAFNFVRVLVDPGARA